MRKGQFYLVTAAVLVIAIVGIYIAAGARLGVSAKEEAGYTIDNIETDLVRAVNIALAEDSSFANVENRTEQYMEFAADFTMSKNKKLSGHLLVGVPKGSKLYITFGNLGSENITGLEVNVSGSSQNLSTLLPQEAYTFYFPGAFTPSPADINYSFNSLGETVSFSVDRVTFHRAEISISEAGNVWRAVTESY